MLRAADEDVATAVAQLRPVISWTAEATRTLISGTSNGLAFNTPSSDLYTGLTFSQILYDGGSAR